MQTLTSILIADDHQLVRKSFALTLKEYYPDINIQEACDGTEVIASLLTSTPDLIILDVNMPNLNGVKCLQQLRDEIGYKGKVIFISVNAEKEFITIAKKLGANGYFTKNISPDLLKSGIERVMSMSLFVSTEWFSLSSSRPSAEIESIMKNIALLSAQENQVLKMFTKNFNTKEVSETLEITSKSVNNYKNRIGKKLLITDGVMFQDWVRKNKKIIELFV